MTLTIWLDGTNSESSTYTPPKLKGFVTSPRRIGSVHEILSFEMEYMVTALDKVTRAPQSACIHYKQTWTRTCSENRVKPGVYGKASHVLEGHTLKNLRAIEVSSQ